MTHTTPTSSRPAPAPESGGRRGALRIGLALVVLIALVLGGRQLAGELPRLTAWVESLGAWGPVVFVALYVLACVAFVPASLLTLGAGALFGVVTGVVVVFVGATVGALAACLIARYVARDWVAQRVQRDPRFAAIDRAIAADGRRVVFLLRLSPVIPFTLLNYALGLTRVRVIDFLIASAGMLPGTLLYVYTGSVAGTVLGATSGAAPARGTGFWIVLTLGFAATAAVTVLVTRLARRALAEATATA